MSLKMPKDLADKLALKLRKKFTDKLGSIVKNAADAEFAKLLVFLGDRLGRNSSPAQFPKWEQLSPSWVKRKHKRRLRKGFFTATGRLKSQCKNSGLGKDLDPLDIWGEARIVSHTSGKAGVTINYRIAPYFGLIDHAMPDDIVHKTMRYKDKRDLIDAGIVIYCRSRVKKSVKRALREAGLK
jgi:hypothetical protein